MHGLLNIDKKIVFTNSLRSSPTVFSSHTTPATSSSSSQPNSIFLSYHSSSSLQLQPAERSGYDSLGDGYVWVQSVPVPNLRP